MSIARTLARHDITEKPTLRFRERSLDGDRYHFDIEGHDGKLHTVAIDDFWHVPPKAVEEYVPKTPPKLEVFQKPKRSRSVNLVAPPGIEYVRADKLEPGDRIRRRTGQREFIVIRQDPYAVDPAKVRIEWQVVGGGIRSADAFRGEKFVMVQRGVK